MTKLATGTFIAATAALAAIAVLAAWLAAAFAAPSHTADRPFRLVQQPPPVPEAAEPPATQPRATTTNDDLDRWLNDAMPGGVERLGPGQWQFFFEERPVMVVTDARAGRMRVISPVAQGPIQADRMQRVLEANFGTALDARYALRDGVLWSAFIHPLPSLDRGEFYNGVAQVITLAETYGTTYSSSGLRFGPGSDPPPDPAKDGLEV